MSPDDDGTGTKPPKCHAIRDSLDLDMVCSWMGVGWIKQSAIQPGLVGKKQQALGIHVEPAQRVNALWEAEFRQCPLPRLIRCELAEDTIWFVECDDQ